MLVLSPGASSRHTPMRPPHNPQRLHEFLHNTARLRRCAAATPVRSHGSSTYSAHLPASAPWPVIDARRCNEKRDSTVTSAIAFVRPHQVSMPHAIKMKLVIIRQIPRYAFDRRTEATATSSQQARPRRLRAKTPNLKTSIVQ